MKLIDWIAAAAFSAAFLLLCAWLDGGWYAVSTTPKPQPMRLIHNNHELRIS